MKVNRVFCYSPDEAKKNKCIPSLLKVILTMLLYIVLIFVFALLISVSDIFRFITALWIVLGIFVIIYACKRYNMKLSAKIMGFATTEDRRIFRVIASTDGNGLLLGGYAAGSIVDRALDNNDGAGAIVGSMIGEILKINIINKVSKQMQNPTVVATLVEQACSATGGSTGEILKVYDIANKSSYIKIKCDLKDVLTNKIYTKLNIKIVKAYTNYNDLISVLNTHKI